MEAAGKEMRWQIICRWCIIACVMKTTRYFEDQIMRKRPYIRREWCERALSEFVRKDVQPDGRVRYWLYIAELGRHLRVVTLSDGVTVHNAFPDRGFEETTP